MKTAGKEGGRQLLRLEEACRFLGVGKSTLYKWTALGWVKKAKIGGVTGWPLRELERLVDRHTRG